MDKKRISSIIRALLILIPALSFLTSSIYNGVSLHGPWYDWLRYISLPFIVFLPVILNPRFPVFAGGFGSALAIVFILLTIPVGYHDSSFWVGWLPGGILYLAGSLWTAFPNTAVKINPQAEKG